MRRLALPLLLGTGLHVHAADHLDLATVGSARRHQVAHQGPFVAGMVPVLSQERELALLAAGRVLDTKVRVRLGETVSRTDIGLRTAKQTAKLMELAKSIEIADRGIVTLGKSALNWDVGYTLQPVGFFEREPDLYDGEEIEGRGEGLPLLAFAWIGSEHSVTLAYGAERYHATNEKDERWGLNASWTTGGLSTALILHKPSGRPVGVGGTLAWTASDQTVVYASAYARRRLKSVLGITHAIDHRNTLTLEWSNDGTAMHPGDWERYRSKIQADVAQHERQPDAASSQELLDDIRLLGVWKVGRHHLFIQWRHQNEAWSLSPHVLLGDEGSLLLSLVMTGRLREKVTVEGAWTRFDGRSTSLYAHLPRRATFRLSVKATF